MFSGQGVVEDKLASWDNTYCGSCGTTQQDQITSRSIVEILVRYRNFFFPECRLVTAGLSFGKTLITAGSTTTGHCLPWKFGSLVP